MIALLSALGGLALLFSRAIVRIPARGWPAGAALAYAVELGNRSLPLVVVNLAFFGMVMVGHAAEQGGRVIGDFSLLGPDYFLLMVREFGPIVTALIVATRAGAGTAAELATMSVTEQIEALELSAGDPIGELVSPRLLGGLLGMLGVSCIGTAVTSLSAALTATFVHGGNGWAFIDGQAVTPADVAAALLKSALAGLAIPLCASRAGLRARGGATAVGEATTQGVVQGCISVILIDFLVGTLFLLFVG